MKKRVIIKKDTEAKNLSDHLSAKENNAKVALSKIYDEIDKAKQTLSEIEEQIEKKRELADEANSLYFQKKEQKEKAERELGEIQKKLHQTKKELDRLLSEKKLLQDELSVILNKKASLETIVEAHKKNKEVLEREIDEKLKLLKQVKGDVATNKRWRTNLKTHIQDLTAEIEHLEYKIRRLSRELEEENEKLTNFIQYKHSVLEGLEQEEADRRRELKEIQYAYDTLLEKKEEIEKKLTEREKDIEEKIKLNNKLLAEIKYEAKKYKAMQESQKVAEKLKEIV